ncbi:hypothetical protein BC826DRAFT_990948 [Russula brevipes]|nr:hypothetical protein BC826DRAFT_990948 [Russula brevipes]
MYTFGDTAMNDGRQKHGEYIAYFISKTRGKRTGKSYSLCAGKLSGDLRVHSARSIAIIDSVCPGEPVGVAIARDIVHDPPLQIGPNVMDGAAEGVPRSGAIQFLAAFAHTAVRHRPVC